MEYLAQTILLLGVAIGVVVAFQRLHVPTSLGYLLVGILLGPHTMGPTVSMPELAVLGEFGIVFLLFTIGLNFSLPQLHALRHQILGLGTGQVVFTTVLVTIVLWLLGLPAAVAFVFGAVFAQSSTTIIGSVLAEQGEENSRHGRLGLAMSVFQDVTAVPFLVVIPVLAVSVSPLVLAESLGWALAKAVMAFAVVFLAGRWLLRPLFDLVSGDGSLEKITLTVLLVALLSAWITNNLGLSLAFGGFLVGMMLGETEFRHQVESSIRPFRDVLLGLFFVSIGMRFDPAAMFSVWHLAVLGAVLIFTSKLLIVTAMVRRIDVDARIAWRTGLILSVGGEFGLALVALALDAAVIDISLGQIAISSVLLAMIGGAGLVRFNGAIANRLVKPQRPDGVDMPELAESDDRQVVIGGYGRVGHTIAVLLHSSGVPFLALDTDPSRVVQGRKDGFQVFFGGIAESGVLSSIRVDRASLVVITTDDPKTALEAVSQLRRTCPHVPVIARARDLQDTARLMEAGAIHAYPDMVEASLSLGVRAMEMLQVSSHQIDDVVREVRESGYESVREADST